MPKRTNHQPRDIYQEVTDRIVAALETGVAPWVRPWHTDGVFPRNGVTRRHYHGINVILLWMTANACGYRSQDWFTFNQARQKGGMVRKGERGTLVTFWKLREVSDRDAAALGQDRTKRVPVLRHFTVFNREQVAENGLLVPLQRLDPVPDVLRVLEPAGDVERGAEEGGAHFGRQFLPRVLLRSEGAGQVPVQPRGVAGPVGEFVQRRAVVGIPAVERLQRRKADDIQRRAVRSSETALLDAGARRADERFRALVPHPIVARGLLGLRRGKVVAASEARQVAEFLGAIRPAASTEDEEEGAASFAAAA